MLPPVASQYCLTSPPTSPAQYQQAFDGLRTVWTEWAAADGAYPVNLPDGRVLWMFGDTIVGRVRSDASIANPWKFVRNSLVVQQGACFTPLMGGSRGNRVDAILHPTFGDWLWPTGGVVENGGNTLRVFMLHMRYHDNPNTEMFDFEFIDVMVATYSLPNLGSPTVQSLAQLPAAPNYGEAVLVPGGADPYLYLYGHTGVFFQSPPKHYVARVLVGNETAVNPGWEYLVDASTNTWSTDKNLAAPVPFPGTPNNNTPPAPDTERGPLDALSVIAHGGGYIAVAKPAGALDDRIMTWSAPAPYGPWTFVGLAASGLPHDLGGTFTYGGHVADLPGAATTLMWSMNRNPLSDVIANNNWYKPLFIPFA